MDSPNLTNTPSKLGIYGFKDEHRFLSNFTPVEVSLDGVMYPSVEHAYQAAKTIDKAERSAIARLLTAGQAKRAGKKVTIRPDWDTIKDSIMESLITQKFKQEPYYTQLKETKDLYIEETNTWQDVYWGVCNGIGQNKLGLILMQVRSQL